MASRQRGGFLLGLVIGVLIGLAVALAVALYVTKVPVPFINKVPQHSPEQDAAEAERNRNWDPNAPLRGSSPKAGTAASGAQAQAPAAGASAQPAVPAPARDATEGSILGTRPPADATKEPAKDTTKDAGKDAGKSAADAFSYFVQVGAWQRNDDAEQARARLAMAGLTARITEREQSGQTLYRVRLGPFGTEREADDMKQQAVAAGFDKAAKVRVQK